MMTLSGCCGEMGAETAAVGFIDVGDGMLDDVGDGVRSSGERGS
jgi:hypothetical protein